MEELAGETPAQGRAFDALDRAIEDNIAGRPTYPTGTVFIAADHDGLNEAVARRARNNTPIVIVYPDGEERFLVPTPRPS